MNIVFIALALAAVPLVFLTMYSRTSEGIKIKLGSFFIIRKFKSDFLKIRSLRDISTLLIRLFCASLIIILVFDPSDVETPPRDTLLHDPGSMSKENDKYSLKLIAPVQATDKFDEDRFFLESFVRNSRAGSGNISIIYNPSEKMIEKSNNDIIIFPARKQAGNAFLRWIELIDFSPLRTADLKIRDTDIYIKNYYPLLIKNSSIIKKYVELEDGSVITVSFEDSGRRILFFGAGISSFWGDMGVSGYFMDIIDDFISNVSLSDHAEKNLHRTDKPVSGQVKSRLSFSAILKTASLIFIIELAFFIFKSVRIRKTLLLFLLLFPSTGLYAEDFKFIELNLSERPVNNSQVFFIIKRELEEKTSIRISPDFYIFHPYNSFIKGNLPEFPYLWITECGNPGRLSPEFAEALSGFIEKGGIVFIDLSSASPSCIKFFNDLGLKISGSPGLNVLAQDHPVYKSFYLIKPERLTGADVSVSTKRTALIISENNLIKRIYSRDGNAVKTGLNIVLYMLSGNYKSDQIHTRQILNRIKRREFFR